MGGEHSGAATQHTSPLLSPLISRPETDMTPPHHAPSPLLVPHLKSHLLVEPAKMAAPHQRPQRRLADIEGQGGAHAGKKDLRGRRRGGSRGGGRWGGLLIGLPPEYSIGER